LHADIEGVATQLKERPRVPQGCMQRLRWPRSLKSAVEIPPPGRWSALCRIARTASGAENGAQRSNTSSAAR
jgi:hypothetical protein